MHDVLVMFKTILLGVIYSLSDENLEFLLHDRLTFRRFAGLGMADEPPTARMVRVHRKRWTKAGSLS